MSEKIAGRHKARGIAGSAQKGFTKTGIEQVTVDLELVELGRVVTTFLYFSDAAAPYAVERLNALGWDGSDDPSFPGISTNEVEVDIKYEMYDGKEQMKTDIVTGGGRVVLQNKMDAQQERGFMARLAKLGKQAGGSSTAPASANTNTKKMAL